MTEQMTQKPKDRLGVGVIGAGARGVANLMVNLCRIYDEHKLHPVAICDNHPDRLIDARDYLHGKFTEFNVPARVDTYDDMRALIDDPRVDVVMITTPQFMHDEPFIYAAASGKMIYCDKPLAASDEAAERMRGAYERYQPRTILGFTRRYESAWQKAAALIEEGTVGTPHMVLLRSVIPFHTYFHKWMRRRAFSGGLVNEKCSHHFDVFNWYTQSQPVSVYANGGRRVFTPREGYPEHCYECDLECPYRIKDESSSEQAQDQINNALVNELTHDPDHLMSRALCVYSPEADIVDHATVNLQFANGMVGSLFFCVFGQHTEDQETIEIVGERGRINLERHSGQVEAVTNFGQERARYDCRGSEFSGDHFGADLRLIRTLSRFCTDQGTAPPAGFDEAYLAGKTAFAAIRALETGVPQAPSTGQTADVT